MIVPDGLVENASLRTYRHSLLSNIDLHAVVSLPAFAFLPYTHEKTYVLYFSRKPHRKRGTMQEAPIWHCIIDNDGFQDGSKRYPINEDDFTAVDGDNFLKKDEVDKCGFVSIDKHIDNDFLTLSSETYLRRRYPIEVELDEFQKTLESIIVSVRELVNEIGADNE